MASSTHRFFGATLAALALLTGCQTGSGTGTITGVVNAPGCLTDEGEGENYDMRPNFFTSDAREGIVEMRIQRGSDFETVSDVLSIFVADAVEVSENQRGVAIPLTGAFDAPVTMTISLNATCDRRRGDTVAASVFQAVSGTITFDELYHPDADESTRLNSARFENVRFEDPANADTRWAELNGEFMFLFNRGQPGQRFP